MTLSKDPFDLGFIATLYYINAYIQQQILRQRDELCDNNIVLGNYKIKINTIIEYLKIGKKLLVLLNKNAWDYNAMAELKKVNNYFNKLNRKYHYPEN